VPAHNAMVVLAQFVAMMRLHLFNLKLEIFAFKTNLCHNFTSDAYHMLWEQTEHCHSSRLHDYIVSLERPG
jgi:hypothetical protein